MNLIVIPNLAEGRDQRVIKALADVTAEGCRVLDIHSDTAHNRTVLTIAGEAPMLIAAMVELAGAAARMIDLTQQEGVHPRLGGLDVCPFVPVEGSMAEAIEAAHTAAEMIGRGGIPVYLYEAAARREATRSLPSLRTGGLAGLIERSAELPPDEGPKGIDQGTGVVCVGARGPLIAFNVWLESGVEEVRTIAARVRAAAGGLPGVRALGLELEPGISQVSMNLTDPAAAGIDDAFAAIHGLADELDVHITGTEIVGLPPERFMPDPDAEAARLLIAPGRSLESALAES